MGFFSKKDNALLHRVMIHRRCLTREKQVSKILKSVFPLDKEEMDAVLYYLRSHGRCRLYCTLAESNKIRKVLDKVPDVMIVKEDMSFREEGNTYTTREIRN